MNEATPRPWKHGRSGDVQFIFTAGDATQPSHTVAELWDDSLTPEECNANANAELIVRAVNSHDALVEACRLALIEMDRITGDIGFEPERFRERIAAVHALAAALAKEA